MEHNRTPLGEQRARLKLTQEQMAVLLKTSQSEISKTERGELPQTDVKRWARAYRLTLRKFIRFCEAAQWLLPLWKFFVDSPADVGEIVVGVKFEGPAAEVRTA